MTRQIPLYTLEGVPDAEVSTHPFNTDDGLGLQMLRFYRSDESDDVVLVVHGLTTSSDMFIMPEHTNLVTYLLDNGFSDVWTLDYRMSNRFPYNRTMHRYNMDDIALYDHPAALRTLREQVGERRIHLIAHCLGSVSVLMSLFGGALNGISSVVANSVGLIPRVPAWSRAKLAFGPPIGEWVLRTPYLDPAWHDNPRFSNGWFYSRVVDLFHPECRVSACHMLSFMWGTGWPGLYRHENLLPITHERGCDLYGATGMNYYRHVLKMVNAGRAVKYRPGEARYASLPDDYLSRASDVRTPVLLTTGDHNRVFTDSNIVCWRALEEAAPGRHELEVFPGYGHQDVFMGKNVHQDIFPRMVDFIKRRAA